MDGWLAGLLVGLKCFVVGPSLPTVKSHTQLCYVRLSVRRSVRPLVYTGADRLQTKETKLSQAWKKQKNKEETNKNLCVCV